MVTRRGELDFKIEFLATIPNSQGTGVEQSLISLAIRYCLITVPKKLGITDPINIILCLDEEYIRDHQEKAMVPILTEQFGF